MTELNKQVNCIKRELRKYFDSDLIYVYKEEKEIFISSPFGSFNSLKNGWGFSLDALYVDETIDFQIVLIIINSLRDKNIKIKIYEWFYTIFNEEGFCVGSIFDSSIREEMKKLGTDYDSARNILEGRLIDEYEKEIKEK